MPMSDLEMRKKAAIQLLSKQENQQDLIIELENATNDANLNEIIQKSSKLFLGIQQEQEEEEEQEHQQKLTLTELDKQYNKQEKLIKNWQVKDFKKEEGQEEVEQKQLVTQDELIKIKAQASEILKQSLQVMSENTPMFIGKGKGADIPVAQAFAQKINQRFFKDKNASYQAYFSPATYFPPTQAQVIISSTQKTDQPRIVVKKDGLYISPNSLNDPEMIKHLAQLAHEIHLTTINLEIFADNLGQFKTLLQEMQKENINLQNIKLNGTDKNGLFNNALNEARAKALAPEPIFQAKEEEQEQANALDQEAYIQ